MTQIKAEVDRPCPGCGGAEARAFAHKNAHRILRCAGCETLYTADTLQDNYEGGYAEETLPPSFLAKRLDDIVAGFQVTRFTGRLLDVGFGAGGLLEAARRAGWAVSGVELARPAVEQARRHGIDAFHGALADAHYGAGSFDVVVATEVLEHVIEVGPLLAEMERVLRPGGLLWATTPHARGISARVLGGAWSVLNPPGHVQLFSVRGLQALLRRAGFEGVSIAAEGVNPEEIVQCLRGGIMSPGRRIDAAYALNAFFEDRRGRRAVKRAINRVLSAFALGDSLKVTARSRR